MTNPNDPQTNKQLVRAQTLPLQSLVNTVIRGLLRAPVLSHIIGKRLVTVYVVGRKSGRHYAIPVAYTRSNEGLLVGSQFAWIRNLHSGEWVHVRLTGRRRSANVRVLTDEDDVVAYLAIMARDNHQFAKFNRIGLGPSGDPVSADLHSAWNAGARIAVLTPQ